MVSKFFLLLLLAGSANAATQKDLEQWFDEVDLQSTSRVSLTKAERQRLFNLASTHPVAKLGALGKYDPDGIVGFCFGRAMTVDLLARKMGLKADSVRKLFIIGDLRSSPHPEWRFHVTTLVKGKEDGEWYTVDPIMTPPLSSGTPLKMKRWIEIVRATWDGEWPGKKFAANVYRVNHAVVIPDLRMVPDIKKETGKYVIETSFQPKENGFTELEDGEQKFYEIEPQGEELYFTSSREPELAEIFQYLGITINTENIGFHNYFVDLLQDLKKPGIRMDRRLDTLRVERHWDERVPNLFSVRLPKAAP